MKKKALICNSIIVLLEIISLILYGIKQHSLSLEFYTMESNLLALITSLLFIIIRNDNKEFIRDLRFLTTSCLTVTFLVTLFVLLPMMNFNFKFLFFQNQALFFHAVCPIISIISYTCFEKRSKKEYLGCLYTSIYGFIMIILNILDKIVGPYPFLRVKDQSIIASILWSIIIIGGSYGIGLLLNTLNKKRKGAKN
jgi:hypothetical protein